MRTLADSVTRYVDAARDGGFVRTLDGSEYVAAPFVDPATNEQQYLVEYCDQAILADGDALRSLVRAALVECPAAARIVVRTPAFAGDLPQPWHRYITYIRFTGDPVTAPDPDPIRSATPADLPIVASWLNQAMSTAADSQGTMTDAFDASAIVAEILDAPDRTSLVYVDDDCPIGHVTMLGDAYDDVSAESFVDLLDILVGDPARVGPVTRALTEAAVRFADGVGRPLIGNVTHPVGDEAASADLVLGKLLERGWVVDHGYWHLVPAPAVTVEPAIGIEMLHELLDVDPGDGLRALMARARQIHYTIPFLTESILAVGGVPLGPVARAELDRSIDRASRYRDIAWQLTEVARVTTLKGSALADLYPVGVHRPQGDLDLVAASDDDFWAAARWMADHQPDAEVMFSVLDGPSSAMIVTFGWDGFDALTDPEMRVEIATAAFTGDLRSIPIRRDVPGDRNLASLLLIAAERGERTFHARDLLDGYMLTRAAFPDVAICVDEVERAHLAPEVNELLTAVGDRWDLDHLAPLYGALPPLVELERRMRQAAPDEPITRLWGGLRIGPGGGSTMRIETSGSHRFARTPVGDFLMVANAEITEAEFDAAVTAFTGLAA